LCSFAHLLIPCACYLAPAWSCICWSSSVSLMAHELDRERPLITRSGCYSGLRSSGSVSFAAQPACRSNSGSAPVLPSNRTVHWTGISRHYTVEMLLDILDRCYKGCYDLFYFRPDLDSRAPSHATVNFRCYSLALGFLACFNGEARSIWCMQTEVSVSFTSSWSETQGFHENMFRYHSQGSFQNHIAAQLRPHVFDEDGIRIANSRLGELFQLLYSHPVVGRWFPYSTRGRGRQEHGVSNFRRSIYCKNRWGSSSFNPGGGSSSVSIVSTSPCGQSADHSSESGSCDLASRSLGRAVYFCPHCFTRFSKWSACLMHLSYIRLCKAATIVQFGVVADSVELREKCLLFHSSQSIP
jgi:hypothetical protein